jgi:hypothetical protein
MLRAIPNSRNEESTPDETIHRLLASSHRQRLSPRRTAGDFDAELEQDASIRRLERRFVEAERAAVRAEAQAVPTDPARFAAWFTSLNATGAGQNDALFPWLAERATALQLDWFRAQEFAHETHFADLVALTQVNMPTGPKLEMARNLWDETARSRTAHEYSSTPSHAVWHTKSPANAIVWESLALGNLMVALATARHYAYQSLGALGVTELTTPAHTCFVRSGLERVGLRAADAERYLASANFDALHAAAWLREVLLPLVTSDPTLASVIAEGALLRLHAAQRCFQRYRQELWCPQKVVARFEYADEPTESVEAEPKPADVPSAAAFRPVKWREVQRPKLY